MKSIIKEKIYTMKNYVLNVNFIQKQPLRHNDSVKFTYKIGNCSCLIALFFLQRWLVFIYFNRRHGGVLRSPKKPPTFKIHVSFLCFVERAQFLRHRINHLPSVTNSSLSVGYLLRITQNDNIYKF